MDGQPASLGYVRENTSMTNNRIDDLNKLIYESKQQEKIFEERLIKIETSNNIDVEIIKMNQTQSTIYNTVLEIEKMVLEEVPKNCDQLLTYRNQCESNRVFSFQKIHELELLNASIRDQLVQFAQLQQIGRDNIKLMLLALNNSFDVLKEKSDRCDEETKRLNEKMNQLNQEQPPEKIFSVLSEINERVSVLENQFSDKK